MTQEYKNILEAKRSLKHHIEFMETLVKHLNGTDKILRGRACWAAWCLHRYFNDRLIPDIQDAIEKNTPKEGDNVQ
jgi:hypothetical protein